MTTSLRRMSACLLGAALLASVAIDPALAQGGVVGSSPGGRTPNSSEAALAGGTGTLNTVRTAPAGGEVRARQRASSRTRQQARRTQSRTAARAPAAAKPAAAPANPNFNVDDRIGSAGTSTGSSTGPGTGPTGSAGAR